MRPAIPAFRLIAATVGLAIPATFISACSGRVGQTEPAVRDSAGVIIVENTAPRWASGEEWTLASEPFLDIGAIDGSPEHQFFQVAGAIRMPDGQVAVANSSSGEIRFFDSSGHFLKASGGRGSGPGEFEGILLLERTVGDSLVAYDWMNRRLSVLSPDGGFARSFELTVLTTAGGFPTLVQPFPDGDLLLATDMALASGELVEGAKRDSAMYYVIDPSGELETTIGAFPGGESYRTTDGEAWVGGGLAFGKSGDAAISGNGFYYGTSDRWEIEYRTKDGRLQRLLRLNQPNLRVSQGDIDRYVADRMEGARPDRREVYRAMYERMPFPEWMPAYGELEVDEEGNLWVEEYRRPGDDQPRWRVFDPEGALLGLVRTPHRLQIYQIGADYVLGRWADEMDVEHIRLYELIKK